MKTNQENRAEQSRSEPGTSPTLFYGWVVVIAAFGVMFLCFGIAYTFSAFFQSLQREFKATRGDVSLVFSIGACLYFSLGAITGPLADRFGPRWVVTSGVVILGLGLALASQAQALWQVYLTYGLSIGVGIGLAYVPSIGAVQRWFIRQRGLASGLATAGIGAGTLVMPPVASWLIDLTSWRWTYLILAGLVVVLGASAALLLDNSPQRRGLLPDGEIRPANPAGAKPTGSIGGASTREALTSRVFWLLYLASLLTSFGLFIPFVHLAAYTKDQGWSEGLGVILVGLIGVGSTLGRFILGGWADKLGRRRSLALMFLGMAVMLLWWLLVVQVWALVIFALGFGLCYGGFVALMPALTADYFGSRKATSIIGLLYTSVSFGSLLGPTLAGVAYDVSQSYAVPIFASAIASLLAVACVAAIPRRKAQAEPLS